MKLGGVTDQVVNLLRSSWVIDIYLQWEMVVKNTLKVSLTDVRAIALQFGLLGDNLYA